MLTTVEFRDIEGFPGYRAGSDGSIWSCLRTSSKEPGNWRSLKFSALKGGYLTITLMQTGVRRRKLAHRIILLSFIGPCPLGMQSCHFDGNRTNNAIANLRWDTPKNNQIDRLRHGTALNGSRCGAAKLTEDKVSIILQRLSDGETGKSIAADVEVSRSTISAIRSGRSWRSIPRVEKLRTKK